MKKDQNKNNEDINQMAVSLPIGIAIGCMLGIIFDNIGLWLSIGVGLGLIFGSALNKRNEED